LHFLVVAALLFVFGIAMSTAMALPSFASHSASTLSDMERQASPARSGMFECDYDLNPTYLYQAIEAKQWSHAAKVFSQPTAQTEAATWVIRKEKNGKLRWRLLPIHAVIIFKGPLELVEHLLQEFPAGAQQKDDQGMLPLHLAFRNDADWDVIEELLTAFPQAIFVKDRKGRTPIECASSRMAKSASVMELYAQLSLSTERQKAVAESRAAVESRVSSLQETHVNTLSNLKIEWENQQSALQNELDEAQKALEMTSHRLEETLDLLGQKSATEAELTQKLELVTNALQKVNENKPKDEQMDIGEKMKLNKRVQMLQDANGELLVLVQTLLDQQTSLKVQLDKDAWEAQERYEKTDKYLKELVEMERKAAEAANRDRDKWRSKLTQSNAQVATKLNEIVERAARINKTVSPQKSPQTGENKPSSPPMINHRDVVPVSVTAKPSSRPPPSPEDADTIKM
jgi:ankyrin repeat protein